MLRLKKDLRPKLREPLGKLYPLFEDAIDDIKSTEFFISVGDATTKNMIKNDLFPNLCIIDNLIQRKNYDHEIMYTDNVLKVRNPPGTITDDLWETIEIAIEKSLNKDNQLILVDGEEDLAVLPCIMIAPEGSAVLYGQPNEGLVLVNVDDVRSKVVKLLRMFEKV